MLTIERDIRFYDTSSLLILREDLFSKREKFIISSVTLEELEHIKLYKEENWEAAEKVIKLLSQNLDLYTVIIHNKGYEKDDGWRIPLRKKLILSDAIAANERDNVIFVTGDLLLMNVANLYFGDLMIEFVGDYYCPTTKEM